jgi:undecaprenyl-diphosphatase
VSAPSPEDERVGAAEPAERPTAAEPVTSADPAEPAEPAELAEPAQPAEPATAPTPPVATHDPPPGPIPPPAEAAAPFGPGVAAFDEAVDRALDHLRGHPLADRAFYAATQLGDWSLLWHLIGSSRALFGERRLHEAVRLSACLGLESLAVNQGIKRLFGRSRPVRATAHAHSIRRPRTSSFPSGHASSGFMAATLLADGHPALAPFWYGLAAFVALSRPYVRVHHASDVVAGAAIGLAFGQVAKALWRISR